MVEADVSAVLEIAKANGIDALHVGYIETGEKKVIITPMDIEYLGSTLGVR